MKLIFVRHGQTDYNKAGLLQGQEKSDTTILVTAHGGTIRTMHMLYPHADMGEPDNASMHEFDFSSAQ